MLKENKKERRTKKWTVIHLFFFNHLVNVYFKGYFINLSSHFLHRCTLFFSRHIHNHYYIHLPLPVKSYNFKHKVLYMLIVRQLRLRRKKERKYE
jgi:hypothetical protein